ncbi:hypothetical protein L249_7062 [Ophiocordyceps polyrhachis-furcata BCC 54312]|uniref:Uncharacterized protein n=1 Tax=Ophiocordyceps polyrhachis-furcata BCC 54312 TaxID=1330021 RepID=A0A367LKR6_9HYPO|nr:hypothetical protein L249_7062 [Ophiocordyceps polyrhachis-furcata BCC 54312]
MGLPLNYRSSKYVRVLQVGTLKYLEKIISISFSHLLNTNTSPASNSSLIASFRLLRDSSSSSLLRYKPGFSSLTRDTFILLTSFLPPSSLLFALQITLFGPFFPTLFSK